MEIAKYNSPLNTTGGISGGGGLGGHKFKSGKSCQMDGPIGTKFGTRLWINLGMDNSPTVAFWGGLRGSTMQKPGKCGQTAGPIGNTFCT